jgi:hypothetical protein
LILSGWVRCDGAEADDSHSNQHCAQQAHDEGRLGTIHNSATTGSLSNCQAQNFILK